MKKIFLLFIFSCFFFAIYSQDSSEIKTDEITTYYFIRHAEKDLSNPKDRNPNLSEIGLQRAENWAEILKEVSLDAVYSTDYIRTMQTAKPTAEFNKLQVTIYDLNTFDLNQFKNATKGKTVLVVGHSNTTPNLVNAFIGSNTYSQIDEKNYSNIYTITIIGTTVSDKLLTIN